jgi:hypothetical protein
MADAERPTVDNVPEKTTTEHHVASPESESTHEGQQTVEIPNGWRYRQAKIGSLKLPYYASPQVQLVMVAFVCFLCPGKLVSRGYDLHDPMLIVQFRHVQCRERLGWCWTSRFQG